MNEMPYNDDATQCNATRGDGTGWDVTTQWTIRQEDVMTDDVTRGNWRLDTTINQTTENGTRDHDNRDAMREAASK